MVKSNTASIDKALTAIQYDISKWLGHRSFDVGGLGEAVGISEEEVTTEVSVSGCCGILAEFSLHRVLTSATPVVAAFPFAVSQSNPKNELGFGIILSFLLYIYYHNHSESPLQFIVFCRFKRSWPYGR
jgi:hypothetical protein